ncbi:MAG: phosphate ABC transporter permease subunit PstC [Pseudomonadota bacterium]
MPKPALRHLEARADVARLPTTGQRWQDRCFRGGTRLVTWLVVLLCAYIVWQLGSSAFPAVREFGPGFLSGREWDANTGRFGVLPQIWGTVYSSMLALLMAGSVGIIIAVFLSEGFLPRPVESLFRYIVELLAAVPSVVYGLWGIHVVIPLLRPVADWLHAEFGWLPLFATSLSGPGLFPAALVLAIMVLPTVAAISQDAIRAVPRRMKEAAYGLGSTRWQAIWKVILPAASSGIFGALVLGLGRALGETMALAMLVGNSNQISLSLFSPANTLAASLALNFPEAGKVETGALMYSALILLGITLAVNMLGAWFIGRASRRLERS